MGVGSRVGERGLQRAFFHQQFALDEIQWQSKGKQSKGKGKSAKSADGDPWPSTRAISFRSTDYGAGYTYAFRVASIIAFPTLMESLGEEHDAAELWRFYKSLPLLVLRRQHSWGSPLLRAAATWRYKEYGHYGHRG